MPRVRTRRYVALQLLRETREGHSALREPGFPMRVIDPGHVYALENLDGERDNLLTFVKREGPGYPGNVGHFPGTTTQDVLRCLIERTKYVDNQIHDEANDAVLADLRDAIWALEERAARRHGRTFDVPVEGIEDLPTCGKCHHIGCEGGCR